MSDEELVSTFASLSCPGGSVVTQNRFVEVLTAERPTLLGDGAIYV